MQPVIKLLTNEGTKWRLRLGMRIKRDVWKHGDRLKSEVKFEHQCKIAFNLTDTFVWEVKMKSAI